MSTRLCAFNKIIEIDSSPQWVAAGINSTMTRSYEITADSDSTALNLVKAAAPVSAIVDSIPLQAPRVINMSKVPGAFKYTATVQYKHAGRDEQTAQELIEPGDERVSADFTGATINTTTAKSQTKYGTNAPEVGLAINQNYDGAVDGTEINDRTGSFSVDTVIDGGSVDNDWFRARFLQVWTFNDATFRSWPAGSVALTGMSSRERSDGHWDITYNFQIFPNETVSTLGGISLGGSTELKGRDFKWIMYRPEVDGTNKMSSKAIGAYVAEVYEETSFADLGIST